jgi:uncharacterized protein
MIKIEVLSKNNYINKVIIKGHANYDNYGQDIVCSAVSSIATTSINGILSLNEESLVYHNELDKMTIEIILEDENTNKLITNMVNLLKELQNKYQKNICIKEEYL